MCESSGQLIKTEQHKGSVMAQEITPLQIPPSASQINSKPFFSFCNQKIGAGALEKCSWLYSLLSLVDARVYQSLLDG